VTVTIKCVGSAACDGDAVTSTTESSHTARFAYNPDRSSDHRRNSRTCSNCFIAVGANSLDTLKRLLKPYGSFHCW
jgi:hypothetical protein